MAIIQIDKQSNKRSCSVRAHGAPHGGTTKNKFIERVKKTSNSISTIERLKLLKGRQVQLHTNTFILEPKHFVCQVWKGNVYTAG